MMSARFQGALDASEEAGDDCCACDWDANYGGGDGGARVQVVAETGQTTCCCAATKQLDAVAAIANGEDSSADQISWSYPVLLPRLLLPPILANNS